LAIANVMIIDLIFIVFSLLNLDVVSPVFFYQNVRNTE